MTDKSLEQLREAVIDYYGTAANVFPATMGSLIEAETASDDRLIEIAKEIGLLKDFL